MNKLKVKVAKKDEEYIHLKIRKEDFEAFCSTAGLFKESFLKILKKSEKDLTEGRYSGSSMDRGAFSTIGQI